MRVASVSVKGLFGIFDHEIELPGENRVTIIHGPNGFGKTVMLRMIAALVEGRTSIFERIPFTEFCLTLDTGSRAIVRRHVEEDPETGKHGAKLDFCLEDCKGQVTEVGVSSSLSEIPRNVLAKVDRLIPAPFRLSGAGWVDDVGRHYSLAEIIDRFPRIADAVPRKYTRGVVLEPLRDLNVLFVETDRLGGKSPRAMIWNEAAVYHSHVNQGIPESATPRVKEYSQDIVRRIQSVLANYAKHSQESDRTFPERLVRSVRDGRQALPEREILSRMSELESKRRRLISLGLLDSESGLRDLTEEDVRRAPDALTIYVEDVQEKLNVFDDIARRIGSLSDIINDRFKYKQLVINREHGFRVLSDSNVSIKLEDLSSGEQHELVVLYELLFRAPKNGLFLVDEPEISLHVGWQSRFLSDLINILEFTDAYAIVATHSPVIIGTRWDLTVELQGPVNTEVQTPALIT